MIQLHLPFPVSVNNMTFNKSKGRAHTKAYKAWINEAGWCIKEQKPKPIKGPVTITYAFEYWRKADPDNLLKACNDLLVTHGLIEGDGPDIVRGGQFWFDQSVVGVRIVVMPV